MCQFNEITDTCQLATCAALERASTRELRQSSTRWRTLEDAGDYKAFEAAVVKPPLNANSCSD